MVKAKLVIGLGISGSPVLREVVYATACPIPVHNETYYQWTLKTKTLTEQLKKVLGTRAATRISHTLDAAFIRSMIQVGLCQVCGLRYMGVVVAEFRAKIDADHAAKLAQRSSREAGQQSATGGSNTSQTLPFVTQTAEQNPVRHQAAIMEETRSVTNRCNRCIQFNLECVVDLFVFGPNTCIYCGMAASRYSLLCCK